MLGSSKSLKNKIFIREMEFEDLKNVFELGETLFTAEKWTNLYRTWDEYEIMERFISDGDLCLVAENDDGKIVGFAIGSVIQKRRSAWSYGYLIWIGIDTNLKNLGIGKKLINRMIKLFKAKKARILIADTSIENQDAIHFFKKIGLKHEEGHIYLSMNLSKGKKTKTKD